MVRHVVRLKLRLLSNRLRTQSVVGTIGYFAIWLTGVVAGGLGGLLAFGLGRLSGEPGLVLILTYTAVFVGWMVIPAMASALDETLDPRRFELLPIRPGKLTAGLLAAGAISPGGLGTLIGLSIATFGSFPEGSLWPVLLMAVTIELALCLVVARLVTTFLSNLLASRRARDVATLMFAVVIAAAATLPALLGEADHNDAPDIEITITSLSWVEGFVWLPPGALAASVGRWADGEYLNAAGLALYGVVAASLIGFAWARSVRKMLVSAPTVGRQPRRRDELDRTLAITPSWLRLPPGPVAGAVAKELRYLGRDNRVRAQLIGSVVPIVVIGVVFRGALSESEYAPFLAAGISVLFVLGILLNQFGIEGGSFWGYVVSPAPLSSVVQGKNLLWGLVTAPLVVLGAVALAVLSGSFSFLAAAMLGSVAVFLVTVALGNVTSIYGAYPIPERNPFGSRGSGSAAAFVSVVISMMASGVLLLPLAVVIGLPAVLLGPAPATAGGLLAIGYGVLLYRLSMRLTSRLLVERQQLLLETIDRDLD